MLAEHLFMHNKKAEEKFLVEIEGAEKDVVKAKLWCDVNEERESRASRKVNSISSQ
jgi:hypothetical protein